jgi:putative transposase
MIFIGRSSLEHALTEYVAHYHCERNHQGIRNQLINRPAAVVNRHPGRVKRRQRLGGMFSFYYREAAE